MSLPKAQMFSPKIILFLITIFLCCASCDINREWVAPDAWSRAGVLKDDFIEPDVCPNCKTSENNKAAKTSGNSQENAATIFYEQLIRFIFKRKKMEYQESNDIYRRSIIFKITPQQLEQLEQSNDPRDWHSILSEALLKAEFPEQIIQSELLFSVLEYTKSSINYLSALFLSSETRFTLILVAAVLVIIYINRRYKYGIILIVVTSFFLFGFVHAYYECNRQLEIEELTSFIEDKEDPCLNLQEEKYSFWGYFTRGSKKQQCAEYLKKKHQIKLPFCRPDDVALAYINNLFFNQFSLIVDKSTITFQNTFEKIPFPYNIVAVVIFGCILPLFVKMVFQHILSPSVWKTPSHNRGGRHFSIDGSSDRLSGENLKLFLESVKHKHAAVSGVQEIKDVQQETSPKTETLKAINNNSSTLDNKVNEEHSEAITCCGQDSIDKTQSNGEDTSEKLSKNEVTIS